MKKKLTLAMLTIGITASTYAQNIDSTIIASIYKNALSSYKSHDDLKGLVDISSGRMIGNEASLKAIKYFEDLLKDMDLDTVYLQPYEANAWICSNSSAKIISDGQERSLNVNALGPSVSTPEHGTEAEVIEVKSFEELEKLGRDKIEGKIVFFNNEVDQSFFNTFDAYGDAIMPRIFGGVYTASYGGVAAIIRSLNTVTDDYPHTGVTRYRDSVVKVPIVAISTNDAEKLSKSLQSNPKLKVNIKVDAQDLNQITSYNVIAEIKGYVNPEKIIVVGGHTDTWYNSPGAHDDGAGCMHSIEVLRIFKELGIKNKNTIRLVLFMDEELNQSGAEAYANAVKEESPNHIFALESDAGGLTPYGFSIDANDEIVSSLQKYLKLFEPYNIWKISKGYAGVDIYRLKKYSIPLAALRMDSQRYFEFHHSAYDTFDKVNRRELQLGSAAMTALIYLVDKYGLE